MEIEVKAKGKRAINKIIEGIINGEDVVRGGHLIVNHLGETTYIAFYHLTPYELKELAKFRRIIEQK